MRGIEGTLSDQAIGGDSRGKAQFVRSGTNTYGALVHAGSAESSTRSNELTKVSRGVRALRSGLGRHEDTKLVESDALQIGQTFAGRYRVEKFLAKGGFGAVYVAEQLETELKVALKVLWPHVLHSADAVEKFRLEARVAGRVGSEHIVKVFDAGFDNASGMPFLVMELLRGAELDKVVEQQGALPAARVVNYFRQIAAGLDKAHGYVTREGVTTPIVHRDLKPENLFLAERETGEPLIKILDFGIAKVLTESTNVSQEVKGTPLYMAFEQVAAGKITPQTDIWPLGLIAFYLLTGKPYWRAANHSEGTIPMLFGELLSLPIEPASERARQLGVVVSLSPSFDAWFARCVERDPARRFASAGECAQALALALETHASPHVATLASAAPNSSAAAPARTLGNTTATPLVSRATGDAAGRRTGALKWALIAGALLAITGATLAVQRLSGSTPIASEAAAPASAPSHVASPALLQAPAPSSAASASSAAAAPATLPSVLSSTSSNSPPARPAPVPRGTPTPSPPQPAAIPTPKPAAGPRATADVYGDR